MENFRLQLKTIIEENDSTSGKVFDIISQSLILISIISFSIETLPNLSPPFSHALKVIELIVVAIFTAEYVLRLFISDKKLSFVFSFYGLIDLFAILPFYIASGIDLRSIRIVRLFRIIRTFKIVRFNSAAKRFKEAILSIKSELSLFLVATIFLLYIASVGIYYFEYEAQPEIFTSVFHCLWWAVATLTSVGYGDAYPITVGGKIFTSIIILIGIGIVAVPTGLLASALSKTAKPLD